MAKRRLHWILAIAHMLLAGGACAAFAQNTAPTAYMQAESAPLALSSGAVVNALQINASKKDSAAKQTVAKPVILIKSEWSELNPAQQAALKPLAANWSGLTEGHKRKWISLAQNYPKMSVADQTRLHARMTEWTALSAKQREQARLNFAQTQELTKTLSPEERKAKWQAYQALSAEEKQKLAAKAPPKPTGAAVAAKPAQPTVKTAASTSGHPPGAGRISIAPHLLGQNSLMPQPPKP